MNHRWINNTCIHCGATRQRREYKKLLYTYPVLGKDGCWYDCAVYSYFRNWYFGEQHRFNRPPCVKKEMAV